MLMLRRMHKKWRMVLARAICHVHDSASALRVLVSTWSGDKGRGKADNESSALFHHDLPRLLAISLMHTAV